MVSSLLNELLIQNVQSMDRTLLKTNSYVKSLLGPGLSNRHSETGDLLLVVCGGSEKISELKNQCYPLGNTFQLNLIMLYRFDFDRFDLCD